MYAFYVTSFDFLIVCWHSCQAVSFVFPLLRQHRPVQVMHWFFSHWTSSKFISPFQSQLRLCCLLFVPCFLQFQGMVAGEISKISAVNAWLCSVFLRFLFSALWRLSPPDWAGLCFIPDVRVRRRQSHQREPQGPLSHCFSPAVSAPPQPKEA